VCSRDAALTVGQCRNQTRRARGGLARGVGRSV